MRWRSRARLERAALGLELADALLHLGLDVDDRVLELVRRRDVVGRRVDVDLLALGQQLAGQRVELGDPLDLVAEELDPDERSPRRPAGARACRRGPGTGRGVSAASLRWYWRSTRWRRTASRRYWPPTRSLSTVAP